MDKAAQALLMLLREGIRVGTNAVKHVIDLEYVVDPSAFIQAYFGTHQTTNVTPSMLLFYQQQLRVGLPLSAPVISPQAWYTPLSSASFAQFKPFTIRSASTFPVA